ncbi:hypothetical protein A9Q79_00800 [Methylophaga sp. 42_25_T18]|nr:hypothetical protein A9Q79_00800 [Methylophaga sp. 42_25_T18]
MIEGIFSIVIALVEIVVTIITTVIELIVGLFTTAGEALSIGEALILFFVFLAEVVWWGILWVVELVASLFNWRKPNVIPRPVLRTEKRNKEEL